jgi:hypothetical protein
MTVVREEAEELLPAHRGVEGSRRVRVPRVFLAEVADAVGVERDVGNAAVQDAHLAYLMAHGSS